MKFIKALLFPVSIIYGYITAVRNMLYDFNILKPGSYRLPVICVGNLSVGGTGKTPMVEYLIRLLKGDMHVATLSRGYKRRTKGFDLAEAASTIAEIGDEPKQFKTKFPEISVAVCENRCEGIDRLLEIQDNIGCILLDDAFQHRSIKAGLNILLTDFNHLYTNDYMLPTGTLREWRSGAKRADIIVVTKCPKTLSATGRKVITNGIAPLPSQNVFFSYMEYLPLQPMNNLARNNIAKIDSVLLFSGIANVKPLEEYLQSLKYKVKSIHFSDHHNYSAYDLLTIKESFNNLAPGNNIILTTEKDVMRIQINEHLLTLKDFPVYYIPVIHDFFPCDKEMFDKLITHYVENAREN
jgi:tetraacyldisaccharide 4'-kinase